MLCGSFFGKKCPGEIRGFFASFAGVFEGGFGKSGV
jgi:hypothetical protein